MFIRPHLSQNVILPAQGILKFSNMASEHLLHSMVFGAIYFHSSVVATFSRIRILWGHIVESLNCVASDVINAMQGFVS